MMNSDIEIVADGLLMPEGPVAFPDGSIIVVEMMRGTLTRLWGDGRSEIVADLGGGPNGAALGPDGAVYVANNGGVSWRTLANGERVVIPYPPAYFGGGWVDRVDLSTGRHERLYTHCGEHRLRGPNDLVFDREGGFWFTDKGKTYLRHIDTSSLFYAKPDGSAITEVVANAFGFNGVGFSPDERTLYVAETAAAKLWSYAVEAPGRLSPGGVANPRTLAGVLRMDGGLDSLAVTQAGNICVGTLGPGGITSFVPGADPVHHPLPDEWVTNLCFAGSDMRTAYVTLSRTGRLARLNWHEPGLRLNFNPY